jgi:hypothetical protein
MFYIKTEFDGRNTNDLYNFIAGATSGNAIQLKITKGFADGYFAYVIDVAYPDFASRFFWDCDRTDSLHLNGVEAAVSIVKALVETGTVLLWVDADGSLKDTKDRYFTIDYFPKGTDGHLEKENY